MCIPIQCTESDITTVQEHLPCELFDLPSKYHGLPLSLKKLAKTNFSLLLTTLQTVFQDGKADLLTQDGRRILVQFFYHLYAGLSSYGSGSSPMGDQRN